MTAEPLVVNLKIGQHSAELAFPAIALENLSMELPICIGAKSKAIFVELFVAHEAAPDTRSKNARCCAAGRNL